MDVQGSFDAKRFFDTLAMIISKREGVKVTVTVKEKKTKKEKKTA